MEKHLFMESLNNSFEKIETNIKPISSDSFSEKVKTSETVLTKTISSACVPGKDTVSTICLTFLDY